MDEPGPTFAAETDPTFQRLEEEIASYDRKSGINQLRFKVIKGAQLASGAGGQTERSVFSTSHLAIVGYVP